MTEGHEGAGSTVGTPGLGRLASVLVIRPFRRLWLVLGLSSLGDWLGLLAAPSFATAQVAAPAAKGAAFGSVIAVQLLPAVLLGPLAGVMADRFDRRYTMVIVDVLRFVLFASIPMVGLLVDRPALVVAWAAGALFIAQAAAMVWTPAKDAAVPNLLSREGLEVANQLTLATTYGVAPVLAALVFAALARLPGPGGLGGADIALYFDAATFLASAVVVWFGIKQISGRGRPSERAASGMWRDLAVGARYVVATPLVRGLMVGVLGAFTGAGVVVGAAKFYAGSLGGGDATFAILFGVLFAGFGIGIVAGPMVVRGLSRRRWFAVSIVMAGMAVAALSVAPRLANAAVIALVAGAGAGMAMLSGITLLVV
ncbi:MFS transporter [Hamadaea sp. NPDC051192]|uniref:MFS transporter n=1 Tax=Hamadaea sp. NPDC051192 TaxID=3154940 RepID=UPI00341EFDCD